MIHEKGPRADLADKLAERDAARDRMAAAAAAVARLAAAQNGEAGPAAALAALDAAETAAALAWSRDPDAAPPVPNVALRADLQRDLAAARVAAEAARRAAGGLTQEHAAEARRIAEIEGELDAIKAQIGADELAPLVGAFAEASATLARLRVRIGTGREILLRSVENRGLPITSFLRTLERIDNAMSDALGTPAPALLKADQSNADWRALLAALSTDADAPLPNTAI